MLRVLYWGLGETREEPHGADDYGARVNENSQPTQVCQSGSSRCAEGDAAGPRRGSVAGLFCGERARTRCC